MEEETISELAQEKNPRREERSVWGVGSSVSEVQDYNVRGFGGRDAVVGFG